MKNILQLRFGWIQTVSMEMDVSKSPEEKRKDNLLSGPPSCATASTNRSWSSWVHRNRCFEVRFGLLLTLLPPLMGSIWLERQSKCWPWTNELLLTKLEVGTLFAWYIYHSSIIKDNRHWSKNKKKNERQK